MSKGKIEFLKELTKLSKEHGVFIAGCGCCGSPFLIEDDVSEIGDLEEGNINWDSFSEEYY